MNNTKTKFIIAISQKLSAAPDSDAKVDLIEELSENLCARYQDMVASGMPEDQAYTAALDKLGDVNELLAYLDCCGEGKDAQACGTGRDAQPDDWFGNLGGFIKQTVDQAVNAASDAVAMVQEAVKNLDNDVNGTRIHLRDDEEHSELEYPSDRLTDIRVNITGDLTVCLDENPNSPIRLNGDTENLSLRTEGGVLFITQEQSASGSFFFSRGLSSSSIELTIPQRPWPVISITTISGDVELQDGCLNVENFSVRTTSGDVTVDGLEQIQHMLINTTSGDCSLTNSVCANFVFHSDSGDLDASSFTAATAVTQTASGDVEFSGDIRDLKAISASGDLSFTAESLPEAVTMTTKSGDCSLSVPDSDGFNLQFSTVSGELHSDFFPIAERRGAGKAGNVRYKDGGNGRKFALNTVSGDIELRKN